MKHIGRFLVACSAACCASTALATTTDDLSPISGHLDTRVSIPPSAPTFNPDPRVVDDTATIRPDVTLPQPPATRKPASLDLGQGTSIDLSEVGAVFGHVFNRLPERVSVLPTENYLYFQTTLEGKRIWGNLRLSPMDRDQGVLHFGYYEFREDLAGPDSVTINYRPLSVVDGIRIQRHDPFRYEVTHANKTVVFELNRLPQTPPSFGLADNEVSLFRLQDESNLRFFLIFDEADRAFRYLLDEQSTPIESAEDLGSGLIRDPVSGFVFYSDPDHDGRKILVAIPAKNALQNNYYDGPFDQLADNYIDGDTPLAQYIQLAYPHTRGRINQYGVFTDVDASRVAIQPYLHYQSTAELKGLVDACRSLETPFSFYTCITPDYQRTAQLANAAHLESVTFPDHQARVTFPPLVSHVTGTTFPSHRILLTFAPHQTGFTDGAVHTVKVSFPSEHVSGVSFAAHATGGSFPSHTTEVTFPKHLRSGSFPAHDAEVSFPLNHYVGVSFPPAVSHLTGASYPKHKTEQSFPPHRSDFTYATHVTGVSFPEAHIDGVSFATHKKKVSFPAHATGVTFPPLHFEKASFPDHLEQVSHATHHYTGVSFAPAHSHMTDISYPIQHSAGNSFAPHQTGYTQASHITGVSFPPPHITGVSFAIHTAGVTFAPHVTEVSFPPDHIDDVSFPPHHAPASFVPDHNPKVTFAPPESHNMGTSDYPRHSDGNSFAPHQTDYSEASHVFTVTFPPPHIPEVSFAPHRLGVSFPGDGEVIKPSGQKPKQPDPTETETEPNDDRPSDGEESGDSLTTDGPLDLLEIDGIIYPGPRDRFSRLMFDDGETGVGAAPPSGDGEDAAHIRYRFYTASDRARPRLKFKARWVKFIDQWVERYNRNCPGETRIVAARDLGDQIRNDAGLVDKNKFATDKAEEKGHGNARRGSPIWVVGEAELAEFLKPAYERSNRSFHIGLFDHVYDATGLIPGLWYIGSNRLAARANPTQGKDRARQHEIGHLFGLKDHSGGVMDKTPTTPGNQGHYGDPDVWKRAWCGTIAAHLSL